MCKSIPYEVVEVQGQWAVLEGTVPDLRTPPLNPPLTKGEVESGLSPRGSKHTHKAYLGLLKNVKAGDYLLVHGDMAINKIDKDEAETVLRLACV